jgi:golgi phosphoprotein 3
MPGPSGLFLHEELMLLALNDEQGTFSQFWFGFGMGAAALAELLFAERVKVEEVKKTRLLTLVRSTGVGEPFLDQCLEKVINAKRRASLATWVGRFGSIRGLKQRVAERLCQRGILRKTEGRVLWVFSRDVYPTVNPAPERELVERLRRAIFGDGEVDARTATLAALTYHSGLLNSVFDKRELKQRKARIEALTRTNTVGNAAQEAIVAAEVAMMAATTAATVAAAT